MIEIICIVIILSCIGLVVYNIIAFLDKSSVQTAGNQNYRGVRKPWITVSQAQVVVTLCGETPHRVIINTPGWNAMFLEVSPGNFDWLIVHDSQIALGISSGYKVYRAVELFGYFLVGFLPNKKVCYTTIDAARWDKDPQNRGDTPLRDLIKHDRIEVPYLQLFPSRREVVPESEIQTKSLAIEVGLFIPELRLIRPLVAIFERNGSFYANISADVNAATLELTRRLTKDEALQASRNDAAGNPTLPLIDTAELEFNLNGLNFNGPITKSGYMIRANRPASGGGDPNAIRFVGFNPSKKSEDYWEKEEDLLKAELEKKITIKNAEARSEETKKIGQARTAARILRMKMARKYGVDANVADSNSTREHVADAVASDKSDLTVWIEQGAGMTGIALPGHAGKKSK